MARMCTHSDNVCSVHGQRYEYLAYVVLDVALQHQLLDVDDGQRSAGRFRMAARQAAGHVIDFRLAGRPFAASHVQQLQQLLMVLLLVMLMVVDSSVRWLGAGVVRVR